VIFVTEFALAREGMLYALDQDMINGDYAFIMFELDQNKVTINNKQPFKWLFSTYPATLKRIHDLRNAFSAAFVLAVKSLPSSNNYHKFQSELKRRAPEPPFYSTAYQGNLFRDKRLPLRSVEV